MSSVIYSGNCFLQQYIYFLLKTLKDNSFYLFYKLSQSILSINKYIENLWYFVIVKICVDFSLARFCFSFQIFFIVYRLTIRFYFFPKFNYFLLTIYHLLSKKDKYLVSKKSLLYALIFNKNMHKVLSFLAFL